MNEKKKSILFLEKRKLAEIILFTLCILLIVDMLNLPTIIIEKHSILGISLCILFGLFFLIKNKIEKIFLKINIITYVEVYIMAFLISIYVYLLFTKFVSYSFFKAYLLLISIHILTWAKIYRIIILYILDKNRQLNEEEPNVYDLKELYEGKIKSEGLILINEKAVSYDLLNREKIINDLYNSVNYCINQEKFVISLTGKWGSGKTTLLNILESKLDRDKFIIINNFKAWKYNNEVILIYELIDEILQSLEINFSALEMNKVVNATISFLSSKSNIDLKFIISNNKSIENMKKIINSYLEHNDKRVVFIIDNLERTSENNILVILKAISTIFDIDRFIFILSYDEIEMKKIFKEKLNIDYDYLEKVVQLPLSVPEINRKRMNEICSTCLENLLKLYGVEETDIYSYKTAISSCFPIIKDMRSFKRKINSITNNSFFGDNNLDRVDCLLLGVIEQENNELYYELRNNAWAFIMFKSSIVDLDPKNQKITDYFDIFFKNDENKKYKEILSLMFPNVKIYNEMKKTGNSNIYYDYNSYGIDYNQSIVEKRICNEYYFDLYFTKSRNMFVEINDSIKNAVNLNNSSKDIKPLETVLQDLSNRPNQRNILDIFEIYIEKIHYNRVELLEYLFNIRAIIDLTPGFLNSSNYEKLEILCAKIIDNMKFDEMPKLMNWLENDYKDVRFIFEILCHIKFLSDEEKYEYFNSLYTKLKQTIVEQNINLYENNNYSIHNIICFMNDKDYISKININEENIFEYLADMTRFSCGTDGYGYFIDYENFNKVTTLDWVDAIINKINKNDINTAQKLLIEVYEKYQNFSLSNTKVDPDLISIYKEKFIDIRNIM